MQSVRMRENTDQNNSEYGQFLRSVHLAILRNSENIETQRIDDGLLLRKVGHVDNEKWNLSFLSKSLLTKRPSSVVISRSKKVACIP